MTNQRSPIANHQSPIDNPDSSKLRRNAEEKLKETTRRREEISEMSPERMATLVHELEVHQIELTMQNDELRRIQSELEKTRDKYSHLYDFAPVGYFTVNEKGIIEKANLTGADLIGIARSALIGTPFSRFVFRDDQDIFYKHLQCLLKSEECQFCELRLVKKDGHEFYARLECMVLKNSDEAFREIRTVVSDITELKMAKALRESEKKFRQLFETINDAVFVHRIGKDGSPGRFIEVNDIACQRLGYTKEELLQLTPVEIGSSGSETNPTEIVDTLKNHGSLLLKTVHVTKDGRQIPVESHLRLFDDNGKQAVLSVSRDITERKRAEEALRESDEKYRSLVESTDDSIYLVDRNGRYLLMNTKYLLRFNRPLDEVIDKPYGEFHSQEETKKFQNNLKKVFETGRSLQFEQQSERDGRYFVRTLSPVREVDGKISAVTITSKDITEKKAMEAQLLQAQKMEALGIMVAGVAHEINNPNSLIMLNVPILQDIWRDIQPVMEQHALKEPRKKYGGLTYSYIDKKLETLLSDMRQAAARIANIVKKLKDFARPSDIADKQLIRVNDSVENAIRLAQTTLNKSGADLEFALSEDLPLIQGNPTGIEQIVVNLLANALQAINHDHGKIKLTTGVRKKDARVFISIADNGRGIDPSISNIIFDPFVTTKQAEGGTGLGLSVTYSLVKAHGGEITFESKEGKGTVFTVSFPTEK